MQGSLWLCSTGIWRFLGRQCTCSNGKAYICTYTCLHFESKPGKGGLRASVSPYGVLTLLSPFCSPCTAGTWVWGLGWSPPLDTFFLPGPPGMGPSLLAVDRKQLQSHTQQQNSPAQDSLAVGFPCLFFCLSYI